MASSIATVSGRDMIETLIDGERCGPVLAELARGRTRAKISDLSRALEGRFNEHHALMCRRRPSCWSPSRGIGPVAAAAISRRDRG